MSRRVAVTGIGAVSSLGLDAAGHFERLFAGEAGVAPWEGPEPRGTGVERACPVTGFRPRRAIRNRMLRKLLQPSGAFAVAAAGQALDDAGLGGETTDEVAARGATGLWVGSPSWDLPSAMFAPALRASFDRDEMFSFERYGQQAMNLVDPLLIVKGLPNAALCGIAIEHGIRGPNANLANGPIGGLQAIATAAAAIRRGDVDVALAGGTDSLLRGEHVIAEVLGGRAWTGGDQPDVAARPFAIGRAGCRPGEGAAIVVLEREAHACARGAAVHAWLDGEGQATRVAEHPPVLERAALAALGDGSASVVFGQGLGTARDDLAEARAVAAVLDRETRFSAATAALGFTGAAGGAFAFLHAVGAVAHGRTPPTLGSEPRDPACSDLRVVTATRREGVDRALAWVADRDRSAVAVAVEADR